MIRHATRVFALLGLGLGFGSAFAPFAIAAPPCGSDVAGKNNPAFSEPGSCAQAKSAAAPVAAAKTSGTWTKTPDGRHQWADGNGSVTVGGYVRWDGTVGQK